MNTSTNANQKTQVCCRSDREMHLEVNLIIPEGLLRIPDTYVTRYQGTASPPADQIAIDYIARRREKVKIGHFIVKFLLISRAHIQNLNFTRLIGVYRSLTLIVKTELVTISSKAIKAYQIAKSTPNDLDGTSIVCGN